MKQKSASSRTFSERKPERLIEDCSIYDVPGVNLDARGIARELLKHPDPDVQSAAQRIIDLLSQAIRAMGKEDLGVLLAENNEVNADAVA